MQFVLCCVGDSEVYRSAVVEPSPLSNQLLLRPKAGVWESRARLVHTPTKNYAHVAGRSVFSLPLMICCIGEGQWEDQIPFYAYYKSRPTTNEYTMYWRRNDPVTGCALFRIGREKVTDWQWTKIFSFHAFGVVPVHVFETGNRTRGTLLYTGQSLF